MDVIDAETERTRETVIHIWSPRFLYVFDINLLFWECTWIYETDEYYSVKGPDPPHFVTHKKKTRKENIEITIFIRSGHSKLERCQLN